MYYIDSDDVSATLPVAEPPGEIGYFQDGVPGVREPTLVSADFMNSVMLELLTVVISAGIEPVKGVYTQVYSAILILINTTVGPLITAAINNLKTLLEPRLNFTGEITYRVVAVTPSGWVVANGATIGDAASGATNRANADTADLFALLWNGYANADLAIQDAAGAPSVRGVSAAADFAAHKRMPLLDLRGVALRGIDAGRGLDPGRSLGSLQLDAMQGHVHPIDSAVQSGEGHGYTGIHGVTDTILTATGVPQGDGTNGTPRTAAETRMVNVSAYPLIKL